MEKNIKKLTILHSNDMHGDFLAENVDDSLVGGVSMLSGYVEKVRNEEKNILYCIAHLLFIEKCAKFPIINANLHIKTNGARLFKPHYIAEVDGMKILFIGILTEEVLSQTNNDGIIGSFVDIDEAAQEVGRICNTYNAIDVDTDNNCIDSYKWQSVPINKEHCPKDEDLENILKHYKLQTDEKYGRLVVR